MGAAINAKQSKRIMKADGREKVFLINCILSFVEEGTTSGTTQSWKEVYLCVFTAYYAVSV